jgi:hypothetical protein
MRLHTRLLRLEKRVAAMHNGPPCGVCAGMGTVDIVIDGETRLPNDPRACGCPECGKVFTILLVAGEAGEDDPFP